MRAIPIDAIWGPEAFEPPAPLVTHEQYIRAVADLARQRIPIEAESERLASVKIVFGAGHRGVRGTCYHEAWDNGKRADLVEVAAFGKQSTVQLAGTTVHELGHVLAGWGAGHGKAWKASCHRLGLTTAEAEGQEYAPEHFAPELWQAVAALPVPNEGEPRDRDGLAAGGVGWLFGRGLGGGCRAGVGTKGGKSHLGSRLRLWECGCEPPVKVRVASDDFKAQCLVCNQSFKHVEKAPGGATPATLRAPSVPR